MTNTLAKMLSDARGSPINYQGKSVVLSFKVPVTKGQEVEFEFIHYNKGYLQGVEVSIDRRKGSIEVNGQSLVAPIFWTSTAPPKFNFKCYPKKNEGIMNIWNVWQNVKYKDNVDAWIGNAGLYTEQMADGSIQFNCSNGMDDINFNDLVFKISLKGLDK